VFDVTHVGAVDPKEGRTEIVKSGEASTINNAGVAVRIPLPHESGSWLAGTIRRMAGPNRDVMRETQEFEAMREALRRAVTPDSRYPVSTRETSTSGPRMHCPVHGAVEALDGEVRCPVVKVETFAGSATTSQCGEPLTPDV